MSSGAERGAGPSATTRRRPGRRRAWRIVIGTFLAAACVAPGSDAGQAHEIPEFDEVFIRGVFSPAFTPPAPGTYELPVIKRVAAFVLLDSGGRPVSTRALIEGKVAVVSFVYTACSDRLGCPLATLALRELRAKLREDRLEERVALLSISFDRERDRPGQLTKYARAFGVASPPWHFLTAPSEATLEAVLASYGQDRAHVYDERGRFTGRYRHVLKVFLVDPDGAIRNIYSAGFLVPEVVVNDIKTLLAHGAAHARKSR